MADTKRNRAMINLTGLCRTNTAQHIQFLEEIAADKQEKTDTRLKAIKDLMDRGYGRATQHIEQKTEVDVGDNFLEAMALASNSKLDLVKLVNEAQDAEFEDVDLIEDNSDIANSGEGDGA